MKGDLPNIKKLKDVSFLTYRIPAFWFVAEKLTYLKSIKVDDADFMIDFKGTGIVVPPRVGCVGVSLNGNRLPPNPPGSTNAMGLEKQEIPRNPPQTFVYMFFEYHICFSSTCFYSSLVRLITVRNVLIFELV